MRVFGTKVGVRVKVWDLGGGRVIVIRVAVRVVVRIRVVVRVRVTVRVMPHGQNIVRHNTEPLFCPDLTSDLDCDLQKQGRSKTSV